MSDSSQDSTPENSPKTPRLPIVTAYTIFCTEQREILRKNHPEYTISEITVAIGSTWANLGISEKREYSRKADAKIRNGEGRSCFSYVDA